MNFNIEKPFITNVNIFSLITVVNFQISCLTFQETIANQIPNPTSSITSADFDPDASSNPTIAKILHEIITVAKYDRQLRPPGIGTNSKKSTKKKQQGPVEVVLQLNFKSIENLDDSKMSYVVQIVFLQEWTDSRLAFSHINPSNISCIFMESPESQIWIPNVFFTNEKKGYLHHLVKPNVLTRIYPTGKVFHSSRITMTLSCPMDLRYFPFDEHNCPIEMQSYGWSSKDLILKWKASDPILMPPVTVLPKFKLVHYRLKPDCQHTFHDSNFSCAKVEFLFDRRYPLYIIQFYIPSSIICVISWIGVFLDPHETEARVSLGITTSLSAIILSFMLNQIAPMTSYIRIIDAWLLFCQGLVLSVLVEFSIVNYLTTHQVLSQLNEFVLPYVALVGFEQWKVHQESKFQAQAIYKALIVDKVARLLYPIVFVTFAISYWIGFNYFLIQNDR